MLNYKTSHKEKINNFNNNNFKFSISDGKEIKRQFQLLKKRTKLSVYQIKKNNEI